MSLLYIASNDFEFYRQQDLNTIPGIKKWNLKNPFNQLQIYQTTLLLQPLNSKIERSILHAPASRNKFRSRRVHGQSGPYTHSQGSQPTERCTLCSQTLSCQPNFEHSNTIRITISIKSFLFYTKPKGSTDDGVRIRKNTSRKSNSSYANIMTALEL